MTETKKKNTVKKNSSTKNKSKEKSLIIDNEKVLITLKWEIVQKAYQKALSNFAKNLKTEGFRKGKAPFDVVEKKVGMEKIVDATLQDILPNAYREAIKKAKKQAITTPEFNPLSIEKNSDWKIEAYFAPFPEIKLGDYKSLIAKGKKEAASFIKKQNETLKKAAIKAKESKAKDSEAISREKLDENEEREINLQNIFKELVDTIKPKIAELLLRQETQAEYKKLIKQLEQYKISIDDYLKRRGIEMEQLSREMTGTVLNRLQLDFILAEISKTEKLSISDADFKKELDRIEDKELKKQFESNQAYLNQLKGNLLQRKTLKFLLEL